MPEPKSMSELPSASSSTPPPAAVTKTGRVLETPRATAAERRAISAREAGPGISVTRVRPLRQLRAASGSAVMFGR